MSVIQFGRSPPPEPPDTEGELIWVCRCGCKTFKLYADGSTECASCEHRAKDPTDGQWRSRLPDAPSEPPPPEEPDGDNRIAITHFATSGASLRNTLSKADPHDTAIVILVQHDGAVTTWGEVVGDEQSAWFDGRIVAAKKLLSSKA